MHWIDRVRTQTLTVLALIAVFLTATIAYPHLPHAILYAQQAGPGGVPGKDAGGAVSSVFGRTGAVVAASGDYTAAQVTNAAATNVANTLTASPQIVSAPSAQITLDDTTNPSHQVWMYNRGGFQSFGSTQAGGDYESIYQGAYHILMASEILEWSSSSYIYNGGDTSLSRAGAGIVAVGSSTYTVGDSSGWLQSSAIGSGVSNNTDLRGHITLASGSGTYSFTRSYSVAPTCVTTDTTALEPTQATTTPTTLTLKGTGTDVVNYVCAD